MKAAVINATGSRFDIENIEIDAPVGREVLVEVKASGLCHTDLHMAQNDFGIPLPAVFGHELAGVVVGIGPDVREFAVGDHVVASLIQYCGHCGSCLAGRTYQCEHPSETLRDPALGQRLTRNGQPVTPAFGTSAFAERALVHENQLAKVPEQLPFPQACLLGCGTVTGAGAAINTAAVRPGDTVAVIGVGGVGLNVISGAKLAGATRIIAVDVQASKLELAKTFGATDVVDSSQVDPVVAVLELTGGGVNHAFEVVGLKQTSEQAVRMTRVGGGAYLIGVHKPGSKIELAVTEEVLATQRRVQGVNMGSSNIKHDIPMYAALYLEGRLNLDDLVSREINISEINEAYDALKGGAIARSVITSF
ncbi:Zn-dependent alcohol dehydrogenase [Sphingobium sp. H39-3-25]|uniref:Zn-dependent alcohol dehydrogenase n=1 Tax=Sphingomonadales TaxID=204457 RepID=UPI000834F401|nr:MULTISPECIES: Zn-dependent alcohol dehydrogenase [Sphingomonadaceae]MDF0491078.1 Zn-dependent alcohol dehydrogenase [Sphingomonas pollutisoli]MDF0545191.1 Zn-dependent alcohol dehydrogenase [Sphingobium arseniciresistens]